MMNGTNTNLILKTPKTESSVRRVWLPKTVADLRKVTPPEEKPLTPDVTNIVQLLQGSPELTSMLSNLIAQAGVKAN